MPKRPVMKLKGAKTKIFEENLVKQKVEFVFFWIKALLQSTHV